MSVDTLDSHAGDAAGTRPRLGAVAGACIGNTIEWYDWTTYTTFSLYFAASERIMFS